MNTLERWRRAKRAYSRLAGRYPIPEDKATFYRRGVALTKLWEIASKAEQELLK